MSTRKITLKSSDGETFEVDESVALESQTIKHMIEDDCADNGIPLPNVTSKILSKVIEYCKKHVESPKSDDRTTSTVDDELKAWDAEFVKVDQATLFDLILTKVLDKAMYMNPFREPHPTYPINRKGRNRPSKEYNVTPCIICVVLLEKIWCMFMV